MMNDELAARALERWLDQPSGTPPPSELEPDVVQAIYVLRPELAPAPRLTADDILASVTAGPLRASGPLKGAQEVAGAATAVEEGAEVVPFPQRSAQRSAQGPASDESSEGQTARRTESTRSRWLRLVGGTGGLGMALVAAATILLVATPILSPQLEQPPASESVALQPAAQAPASPAATEAPDADAVTRSVESTPSPPPVVGELPMDKAPIPGAKPETAFAIEGRAPIQNDSFIPELQDQAVALDEELALERVAAAAPAQAEGGDAAQADAPPSVSAGELDQLRSKAARGKTSGWRKELSNQQLGEVDGVIAEAAAQSKGGDPRGAGDRLAALVWDNPYPVRTLQMLSALSVEYYLAAGDPAKALSIAEYGLQLAVASSPERTLLQVAFGDALRARGDLQGAADAYRSAR